MTESGGPGGGAGIDPGKVSPWLRPGEYHAAVALEVRPVVADFYRGWDAHQRRLVETIRPLSSSQLDLRAGSHLWPVRMLANHVISARAWWFHGWMGEGGPEFGGMMDWDEDLASGTRPASEIVRGLEVTWGLVESGLARWSHGDLDAEFTRPVPNAEGERPVRNRQYIIWHVAEHDVHHGGEISLTLGLHGLRGVEI